MRAGIAQPTRRRARLCRLVYVFTVVVSLAVRTSPAFADSNVTPGLCLVPVKSGISETIGFAATSDTRFDAIEPTGAGPVGHLSRFLPELASPVLYDTMRPGAFTVSRDNVFERFRGELPTNSLTDKFFIDKLGKRILGLGDNGIYAFDPDKGEFRFLLPRRVVPEGAHPLETRSIYTIAYVPRLGDTLVGTDRGVYQLVGSTVRAWGGPGEQDVGPVAKIEDLAAHEGVMFASGTTAWIRHDDGSLEPLIDIGAGRAPTMDGIWRAVESHRPGRIVIEGDNSLWEIAMRPSPHGFSPANTKLLYSYSSSGYSWLDHFQTRSGDYLLLGRPGWTGAHGLERLEPDGLHEVGGDSLNAFLFWGARRQLMVESVALGLVLMEQRGRWYGYDGTTLAEIPALSADKIGEDALISNLPSIGEVVVKTVHGLFVLTAERLVEQLRLPFNFDFVRVEVADFAEAHVGLIAADSGLYALTTSNVVLPIKGAEGIHFGPYSFIGVIPARNAMLIRSSVGMELVMFGSACTGAAASLQHQEAGPTSDRMRAP